MSIDKIELDSVDKQIIHLLQDNPKITHTEIAEIINRSQPTVGLRIKKMHQSGILQVQTGINFNKVEMHLAKVSVRTKNPEIVKKMCNLCPFMVNCFKLQGRYNTCFFLAASKLDIIEEIVNIHFRSAEKTIQTKMDIIFDTAKNFIIPIDFNEQAKHNPLNEKECQERCPYCEQVVI